jgi:hypothetical protein
MNNFDDDDMMIDLLIHEEEDEFTEAVVMIANMIADDDTGDDDDIPIPFVWGSGSRVGKAPNIERRRVFYSHLLCADFWGPSPLYNATYFKKFFKTPIGLFDDIVAKVTANNEYFRQKTDAVGKMGLSSIQKVCSAVRQLTPGVSLAEHDDKYRMAASTGLEAMKRFCHSIIEVYGDDAHSVTRMVLTSDDCSTRGVPMAFLVVLAPLIACIRSGRTAPLVGKVCFKESRASRLLFWRQLRIIVVVFGISTSALQGR